MNTVANTPRQWRASLALGLESRSGSTRLTSLEHHGPLRVQAPFVQEDGSCHVYILHPPGGLVGGDQLDITVKASTGTKTLLTSPSAGKFYGSEIPQKLRVNIDAVDATSVEWLPQETIFFDGASASMEQDVRLGPKGSYLGWEVLCLGRHASGEQFSRGRVEQSTRIYREGRLIHRERIKFSPSMPAVQAEPWGLGGQHVVGTFVAVSEDEPGEATVDRLRAQLSDPCWGITAKSCVMLVRYLGLSSEECRAGFQKARRVLLDEAVVAGSRYTPRIWNT